MLHTEPSFCIYADEDVSLQNETKSSEQLGSGEFTFAERSMQLIVEDEEDDKSSEFKNEQIQPPSPKMYLATGFGIDGIGGTEYYKMIVDQDPYNPMALRKYAQLLQSRGDVTGAEDYYLRATVEDPNDGESLMQYAKLVWEVHGDQDRALSYFEKAALAAPQDWYPLMIPQAQIFFVCTYDRPDRTSYTGFGQDYTNGTTLNIVSKHIPFKRLIEKSIVFTVIFLQHMLAFCGK